MNKTAVFCVGAIVLAVLSRLPANARSCDIAVVVDAGPDLSVKIPCMAKADLNSILAEFFGKGDESAARQVRAVMQKAREVTLVITTRGAE